ncbi:hypothetical protein [Halovenus sp. HT40]|uniref:hypothetical protein n=1 Tax=Halovenus sp. HT40 TaxID=3126691 RepID=UPI00300F10FD
MSEHESGRLVETVPAVAGVVFSIASAVQFLDGTFTLGALGYQFSPAHSYVVSLIALIVVFASSRTKDWEYYESWEQVLVGVTILIMTAHQFIPTVARTVSNQNPLAGSVAFGLGLLSWGVLAR